MNSGINRGRHPAEGVPDEQYRGEAKFLHDVVDGGSHLHGPIRSVGTVAVARQIDADATVVMLHTRHDGFPRPLGDRDPMKEHHGTTFATIFERQ